MENTGEISDDFMCFGPTHTSITPLYTWIGAKSPPPYKDAVRMLWVGWTAGNELYSRTVPPLWKGLVRTSSIVSQQFCFHSKDGLCCHGNLITPGSALSILLSPRMQNWQLSAGFGDLQASTLHLHTRILFSRQGRCIKASRRSMPRDNL